MAADVQNITDEHIASIAERMSGEGRAVSPVTIWSEMRRGSIVDIAAALQRWRDARQPEIPAAPVAADLPHDLSDSVLGIARRLWATAREQTEDAHRQRLDAVNQRLDNLLAERNEALAEYQNAEAQTAAQRQQLSEVARIVGCGRALVGRTHGGDRSCGAQSDAGRRNGRTGIAR